MNSFPAQDVRAIGLKLEGAVASSVAKLLPISLMAAVFHADGIVAIVQQQLKRSARAESREEHFLKIWSNGDGDEADLERLITARTSSGLPQTLHQVA